MDEKIELIRWGRSEIDESLKQMYGAVESLSGEPRPVGLKISNPESEPNECFVSDINTAHFFTSTTYFQDNGYETGISDAQRLEYLNLYIKVLLHG